MDHQSAIALAREWVSAWNDHDVDRVLAFYADAVMFSSPFVATWEHDEQGTLHGAADLRAFFADVLGRIPDLSIELRGALAGVDSVTVVYVAPGGQEAAETMILRDGRIIRSLTHYGRRST